MCGRFSLATTADRLAARFEVAVPVGFSFSYNLSPGQAIAVVHEADGGREMVLMHWGLIPGWSRDRAIGRRLINARAETAHRKPAFREAFRRRRALVPATGFFEWADAPGGRQPWHFRRTDGAPFAIAALWERWTAGEETIQSCTLLTMPANDLVAPVHHRMPVIIATAEYSRWLNAEPAQARPLLGEANEELIAYTVDRRVNDPRHDDESCITPTA